MKYTQLNEHGGDTHNSTVLSKGERIINGRVDEWGRVMCGRVVATLTPEIVESQDNKHTNVIKSLLDGVSIEHAYSYIMDIGLYNTLMVLDSTRRSVISIITNTVISSGTSFKTAVRSATESISVNDSMNYIRWKLLTQVLNVSHSRIPNTILMERSEIFQLSERRSKGVYKLFSDTLSILSDYSKFSNSVVILWQKITLSHSTSRSMSTTVKDGFTLNENIVSIPNKVFSEIVNAYDEGTARCNVLLKQIVNSVSSLSKRDVYINVSASIQLFDDYYRGVFSLLKSALILNDTRVFSRFLEFTERFNLIDTHSKGITYSVRNSLNISHSTIRGICRDILERATIIPTYVRSTLRTFPHTLQVSDSKSTSIIRALIENLDLSSWWEKTGGQVISVILTQLLNISESRSTKVNVYRNERVNTSDSIGWSLAVFIREVLHITEVRVANVIRSFSDTFSLSEIMSKRASKFSLESLYASDSRVITLERLLKDKILSTGRTLSSTTKVLLDSFHISEEFKKHPTRVLTDALSLTETLGKLRAFILTQLLSIDSRVTKTPLKVFSESLNLSDSYYFGRLIELVETLITTHIVPQVNIAREFAEALSSRTSYIAHPILTLRDSALIHDLTRISLAQVLTNALTIADSHSHSLSIYLKNTLRMITSHTKSPSRVLADSFTLAETHRKGAALKANEFLTLAQDYSRSATYTLTNKLVGISTYERALMKSLLDSLTIEDSFRKTFIVRLVEGILLIQTATRIGNVMLREALTSIDSRYTTIQRSFLDSIHTSESSILNVIKPLAESLQSSDSYERTLLYIIKNPLSVFDRRTSTPHIDGRETMEVREKSDRSVWKEFSYALSILESRSQSITKVFHEFITPSSSVSKAFAVYIFNALSLNDTIRRGAFQNFVEALSLTSTSSTQIAVSITNIVNIIETRRIGLERSITDVLSALSGYTKGVSKRGEESIGIVERVSRSVYSTISNGISIRSRITTGFTKLFTEGILIDNTIRIPGAMIIGKMKSVVRRITRSTRVESNMNTNVKVDTKFTEVEDE